MERLTLRCDLTQLRWLSGGDPEFEAELMQLFYDDAQVRLRELQLALSQQDLQQVCNLAHYLKGASANLGFESFHDDVVTLERRAKSGQLQGGDRLVILLEQQLHEFMLQIPARLPLSCGLESSVPTMGNLLP